MVTMLLGSLCRGGLRRPVEAGCNRRALLLFTNTTRARSTTGTIRLPLFAPVFEPRFQEKVAFTDHQGHHFTFAQLGRKAAGLAAELEAKGVKCRGGDEQRVAFMCERDLSFPTTLISTWMTGSIAIPLSSSHPDTMLEYFLKSTGSKLVCSEIYKDKLNGVAKSTGTELLVVNFDKLKDGDVSFGVKVAKEYNYEGKGGLILFTSGTTGQPKGVLLTHSNLLDQVTNICDAWEITEKDTMLHVLPLHHTHGLIHALISPLAVGARSHMLQKFDPAKAWAELLSTDNELRPNVLMGVPTVYIKLIEEFDKSFAKSPTKVAFIKETLKQKMRLILSGSASLPVPVLERFEQISGHRLLERYGMTEIGMALTNPLHGERKPGFVGKPFETVKLRVVDMTSRDNYKLLAESDSHGTRILVDKGEKVIGDLLVKGPSVFKEYWGNPEATKKEFTNDGWFITGDTVEFTEGAYKILGRKSVDIIKSGGYKLSALEIETQLLSFPEIKEVAVMGLPDPTWGQRVVAVLAWNGKELSLAEFKELAKTRVAPYAIPTLLKSLPELPRNHLGKVNKKELVKIFAT